MAAKTSVGIVQMCATADVRRNLNATTALVAEAAKAGARVVLVPEAFAFIGSEQCYILAPAQHGHRGRQSYGHGRIVDPWGEIVAECEAGDGFAVAEVDPAWVAAVRAELPSLANRRPFE